MKSKFFRAFLTVAVAAMLLMNVACGSNSGAGADQTKVQSTVSETTKNVDTKKEAVKIAWLTSQAKYHDVYKKMADQLTADENITVDFQVIPDDQFYTIVKTKLATSEVPDVLEYNAPNENEALHASQNMVDLSNEPWVARLSNPGIIKDWKDRKIYAMPKESSSFFGACYYNKKVLDSLGIQNPEPKTYKEFLDILEKIKTSGKGITPIYMSEKDSWTTQVYMTLAFGGVVVDNKDIWNNLLTNKTKWTDVPEFKDILSNFMDLYKKGYTNKDHLSATYDMAKEAVATGKAAMMLNGEWAAADIAAKWPDTELGAFIIPFRDKLLMGTGAYVQGLFVPKAGKQVENAKKFLNLWSQPKYQNIMYASVPGISGFKDVDGGKVLPCVTNLVNNYINTGKYYIQMDDAVAFASPIFPDLMKYYVDMTTSSVTPEQVMQEWQKKYEDYMKQKQQPGF